jgi:hypothetical protein
VDRKIGLRSAFEEKRETGDFTEKLLAWAGAYTILLVGFAHLLIAGEHFLIATYLGILFVANCVGAVVVAAGLYWGRLYPWSWLLGILVSGGAFVGFVASRTIGLPEAPEFVGQWTNIGGLMTLALEGLFLSLAFLAITPWGRSLVRTEQGRIDRERVSPMKQETPEHFALIEEEMFEIRSQMAADISDLRKHVEPQAVREQAKQGLRERLNGALGPVRSILKRWRA